jgi:hypothetical protein
MFYSILFPTKEQYDQPRQREKPDYFKDLNLDQIFTTILMTDKDFWVKGQGNTVLESVFNTPLKDPDIIRYRQAVLSELEDDGLRGLISGFAGAVNGVDNVSGLVHASMTSMESWRDNYLTRGKLIDCAERYCEALTMLSDALPGLTLRSEGLRAFGAYLVSYVASEAFTAMCGQARRLREKIAAVEICLLIKNETVRVRPYEGQADLARDIRTAFSKFCPDSGEWEDRLRIPEAPPDIHMEITLLNMAARLYKDVFAELDAFCAQYYNFADTTILRFAREITFYLSWLEFIAPLREGGLKFCYPKLGDGSEDLYSRGGFDLSLAYRNGRRGEIVPNDFALRTPERIIVVTGPNQGGKTTFARAFGQMHYLASLGLCVPGREASLYLFDTILTHFEREEDITMESGKLQEDLTRLRQLLEKATPRSVIIINEIFASTTLADAVTLGGRMMDALADLGAPAVVVTFLDELAGHGPETVSMMSIVSESDPAERTFKIMRKPPDGLAYAVHLARKYGLTYEQLSEEYHHEN